MGTPGCVREVCEWGGGHTPQHSWTPELPAHHGLKRRKNIPALNSFTCREYFPTMASAALMTASVTCREHETCRRVLPRPSLGPTRRPGVPRWEKMQPTRREGPESLPKWQINLGLQLISVFHPKLCSFCSCIQTGPPPRS